MNENIMLLSNRIVYENMMLPGTKEVATSKLKLTGSPK